MASYETDHNIQLSNNSEDSGPPRRLDLSSFYSHLNYVNTASNSRNAPPPRQSDVAGAYRLLANAYQVMQGERTGVVSDTSANTSSQNQSTPAEYSQAHSELLQNMIDVLMHEADQPPSLPDGVPRNFFDELERVSKGELQRLQRQSSEELSCPICQIPFLEDQKPLVVRLRCSKLHIFDLECLQPWLALNPTCPLDRQRLVPEQKRGPTGADPFLRSRVMGLAQDADQRHAFSQASSDHFSSEDLSEEVDDMYG